MNVLLAIPLLVAPAAPPASGEGHAAMITYEIRLVDCDGLGWREDFQARLRFGGHRAGSSAWVADSETIAELADRFASAEHARVVAAPKVSATPGDPAIVGTCTTRHFVVHAEPGDAPGPEGEPMPPRPVVAPVDDGSQIRLIGRPAPEGMHLVVEVIDSRVSRVHEVEAASLVIDEAEATFKVQVPEVSRREMGGEWVLPADHGLVLSLGVESDEATDGSPKVRERLLLISADANGVGVPVGSPAADPEIRRTGAIPADVACPTTPTAPATVTATRGMPPLPAPGPAAPPITPPVPGTGLVMQAGQVPTALAATPWGLLPILPVEFAPIVPAAAPLAEAAAMPLPSLPSRTLPPAIDAAGRPIDPRTDRDREAEQTGFTPYVDGQPVPSPQVTIPPPDPTPGATLVRDSGCCDDTCPAPETAPAVADGPKKDASLFKVRFSLNLARGLSVDVGLGDAPEATAKGKADAADGPVRR